MTQITIDEQKTALAPVLAAIYGISKVYEERPEALQPRALPCITLTPGAAVYRYGERGAGHVFITRKWYLRLYVMVSTEGREYQAELAVHPFLTRIPDKLAQYPEVSITGNKAFRLSLDGGGDRGPILMTYAEMDYSGTEFEIETITEEYVTPV